MNYVLYIVGANYFNRRSFVSRILFCLKKNAIKNSNNECLSFAPKSKSINSH